MTKKIIILFSASLMFIASSVEQDVEKVTALSTEQIEADKILDPLAIEYIKLSLEMDEKEAGYVDAYYGPASYKEEAQKHKRELSTLGKAIDNLKSRIEAISSNNLPILSQRRQDFLSAQLTAAQTRHKMLSGETLDFRSEAIGLFAVAPTIKPLSDYDAIIEKIDAIVPGEGTLPERINAFENQYNIPKDRLKVVFDAAIAECKKRTAQYIALPKGERFTLEFVTDKSWSGYNYYQGQYESLIQVNTDLPIRISRAVDLGCHEGYPGHHTLNMLLEKHLSKDRGWQEFSIYPLYSPQSLIAEGSANYGIDLAFPNDEKIKFEQETLYPLAGLDPNSAAAYQKLQDARKDLAGVRFTISSHYLNGEINRDQAIALTQKYGLVNKERARQTIDFTDQYRSYVINYGLGQKMVADYIEKNASHQTARWGLMERLLSEPSLPKDLK